MADCRLLPHETASGPWNMAADEVLLNSAAAGLASLRFYGWTEPTLSLGYFQAAGPARGRPGRAGLPWVRRASGGTALVHHHEVTYALALPAGPPWQRRGESWLCRMHGIIRDALAECGVQSQLCSPEGERGRGEALCFLHQAPGDLLLAGSKIVGSAQRKLRGALMQHGGILLAASGAAPELPGIAELSGHRLAAEGVGRAVAVALARDTRWRMVSGDWTPEERRLIDGLVQTKYTRSAWNEKR
jgi:lipoate-protein ligase A